MHVLWQNKDKMALKISQKYHNCYIDFNLFNKKIEKNTKPKDNQKTYCRMTNSKYVTNHMIRCVTSNSTKLFQFNQKIFEILSIHSPIK